MANYFSIFLVILTVGSGLIWLVDSLFFKAKRIQALKAEQAAITDQPQAEVVDQPPYIVDTAQQTFPVIAIVLILRSFLYEPFQIPSGSMMPTLLVGDFILVEKYAYGLRDPLLRKKFIETGEPERGDVVVFKYPVDPNVDYIKRVIGLPGDKVIYKNKQIFIKPHCEAGAEKCEGIAAAPLTFKNADEFMGNFGAPLKRYEEQLGEVKHDILRDPRDNLMRSDMYRQPGMRFNEWLVPEGHYFVMGDNRDNSQDGRYWGFVPEENLVGKAVAIWISFEFERAESDFLPTWIPTGIRFNRVGGIE